MRVSNTITVASDAVKAPGNPSITWNLTATDDWEDCPFIDLGKVARGWNTSSQSVDAEGNLSGLVGTGLSRQFFISSAGDNGDTFQSYRNGDYTVLWDGGAGVGLTGSEVTVNSVGTGTASITFTFAGNRSITFTGIDSADPPTNVRIIKDTDISKHNAGQIFRDEFLDLLRGKAYALRFMDWMVTNSSTVVDWADYPTTSWQRWRRVPVSVMVALCNELECHGWFCIPHQATDAFVTSFATAINSAMDAGLHADIEYSNEVWNSSGPFTQSGYVQTQANALWGVNSFEAGQAWAGRRFVQVMDLVEAVSASRFRGVIASQAANVTSQRLILDAPQWKTSDAVNYEAPHTRARFFAVADYFSYGDTVDSAYMSVFDANHDAGNLSTINETFWNWNKSQIATTKGYLDNSLANCTATDTVDGLTRNLRLRTYEGGSNHTDPASAYSSRIFLPLAWQSGVPVVRNEVRKNQYGRLYRASAAGTTGATEPTHTNSGSVSDGAVTWLDLTGAAIDTGSFDVRVNNGNDTRLSDTNPTAWAATTAYSLNDRVINSNGTIYKITTAGTSGATQPTHTSGAVTIDGVGYTYEPLYSGNYRLEYAEWCKTYMYDGEQAACITELWNYLKSIGAESPCVFTAYGRQSKAGFWGKFAAFQDTGATRVRPIGDILAAWSTSHPQWWTD